MYTSSFRACLLILVLMSPWTVFAAGLGKLTINSALGQPLDAEIDLVAVKNEEISSLAAKLGSHEAFSQAGVDYKSFFSTFDISIDARSNGDPFIRIISPKIINEPFLNMLIELNWASGRLMREYTVLLDPVDSISPEPVAPVTNDYTVSVEIQSPEKKPTLYSLDQADPVEPAPAQALNSQLGGSSYTVQKGDTLSEIARQFSPGDVSLNQILIAMFRANRDAFIEDNINLLKAGVVLQMPSQSEIAAISKAEANKEVQTQVADWRNYRSGLVTAVSEAPTNEEISQADAGQIISAMPDEGMINEQSPTEVLRLSSGGQYEDVSSDGSVTSQDRLRMMEEDAVARNLALQEANERIAMLEKNILDLQRLLEIQDPTLAEAQQQAENLLSPEEFVPEPEMIMEEELEIFQDSALSLDSETIAVISDQTDLLSDTVMEDAAMPEDSMVQTGIPESFASVDETGSNEAPSITSQLMNNIEYVGGAAAFLLLGTLAAVRMRRKKSEDDFDAEEAEHASSTLRERLASVAAVDSQASHEKDPAYQEPDDSAEVDAASVNEALHEENVEQMDAEFEDDLKHSGEFTSSQSDEDVEIDLADSVNDDPQVENREQFDETEFDLDLEEPLPNADLEALEQAEPELDLNVEDEPLLERPKAAESIASESGDRLNLDAGEPESSSLSEDNVQQSEIETLPFESNNEIPFEMDMPGENDSTEPDTIVESESDKKIDALDTPLDLPDISDSTLQPDAEKIDNSDDFESSLKRSEDADLELDLDAKSDSSSDSNLLSGDSSLSDLKSEMDISMPDVEEIADQPGEEATTGEKDAHWHEVETKIDLAKAYLDMEDFEGAKEILEEVMKDGDSQQQENAKTMLAQL